MAETTNEPQVTVVMAVYAGDAPNALRGALDSVAAQTLRAFECLIAVDGPVPQSLTDVLDSFAAADPRFRIIRLPENRGPGAARNAAVAQARAPYVAVADADDRCAPERLERQLAFMNETGADLAGTFLRYIGPDGAVRADKRMPVAPEAVRRAMVWLSPINNPTVIARTEVLRRHPYNESLRFAEDYDLWVRLARAGRVLRNQPEFLYDMRAPDGTLARRRGFQRFRNDLAARLHALPLYPLALRPALAPLAVALSAARLLPAPVLTAVYALRNRLGFVRRRGENA